MLYAIIVVVVVKSKDVLKLNLNINNNVRIQKSIELQGIKVSIHTAKKDIVAERIGYIGDEFKWRFKSLL